MSPGTRSRSTIAVILAAVLLASLGCACVIGVHVYREFNPCSHTEVSFANELSADLVRNTNAVDVADVLTYDCDSGALPMIDLSISDRGAFVAAASSRYSCERSAHDDDVLHDCVFEGLSFDIHSDAVIRTP